MARKSDIALSTANDDHLGPRLDHRAHRSREPWREGRVQPPVLGALRRAAPVGALSIENRAHFLAYASSVMRSIIVDFARQRLSQRRGGGAVELPLDTETGEQTPSPEADVVRVHDALGELAAADERLVRLVEMRYFGGLTEEEIAEAMGVSSRTVQRDWEKARLLLSIALK